MNEIFAEWHKHIAKYSIKIKPANKQNISYMHNLCYR